MAGLAHDVRANGAFPDSLQVLAPAHRPELIVLATNFGLIISNDAGQTWSWTCEPRGTTFAYLYQAAPTPGNRLYTISSRGLMYSDDESCTWLLAGGTLATNRATDAFVDRSDGNRVLAIASPLGPTLGGGQVFASSDAGTTFDSAIFTAPASAQLTGIEIARSDPNIVYLAMNVASGANPMLVRSADGGSTWDPALDVEPDIGPNSFRIIAVDPADPRRLFLRVSEELSESLAVSDDAGATFAKPVTVADRLTAFLRLASGTILVTGIDNGVPVGFRSTDGGKTFVTWVNVPHVRALAERDGKLFAAGDNFMDGFALAVSTDEGTTFQPLMTFDKVRSIKACAQQACLESCLYQSGLTLWSEETCCSGVSNVLCDETTKPPAPKGGGCGCQTATLAQPSWGYLGAAVAVVLLCNLRRRTRRHRLTSRCNTPARTLDEPLRGAVVK